jgi:hypothetical protein
MTKKKPVPMKKKAQAMTRSKAVSPIRVGNTVFCRTVTHYYTGRIVAVTRDEIVLADAAWIADSGRFADAMRTGELNEIEPYPDATRVSLMRGAGCDVCDWPHPLPRTQK